MTANVALSLDALTLNSSMQMRVAGIDPGTVVDYAEAMEAGADFPPIIVFTDGERHWPADGFHRIEAVRKIGRNTIAADVRRGSQREAVLFAAGANASHGLRRTNADKRRSVVVMLTDPEWSRLADREIGKRCAVDHKTVGNIRRELTSGENPQRSKPIERLGGENPHAVESSGGSMVERLLAKAETSALIAECRRRGLEVSGDAD